MMKEHIRKSSSLLTTISKRIKRLKENSFTGIRDNISARKTLAKVGKRLELWIGEGKHHEYYDSMDDILEELGLTKEELSFYCSRVLKKKFLTWRKELRIEDAKKLLLKHPEAPACHIGYVVGFGDKSNFRQQFRSVAGCTPTEWREKNLKEYDHS